MTPTTEAIARHVAKSSQPQPVNPWELPRALTHRSDEIVEAEGFDD